MDEVRTVDILEVWLRDLLKDMPIVINKASNTLYIYVSAKDTGDHGLATVSSDQIMTRKNLSKNHWEVSLFPHGAEKTDTFYIDINNPDHLGSAGDKIKMRAEVLIQQLEKRRDVSDYRQHWHST